MPSASYPAPSLGVRPLAGLRGIEKVRMGMPTTEKSEVRLQPDNRKVMIILFFPGTLVAPGLTRPRDFLMLLG